ncbi:MAG: restriction endonuclease subunit S [Gammaproteobacteria bacterium]|nr:restriction endonuclease subunit S [Gammaproteobacteria bacterium]MDA7971272.1 restriction endonuclease subunit S [Gammaproteobacteria bacterium]MDA7994719.1 restriction endonuclease subunit S [Gammaproteobacteria bacterium]MDA8023636.1 restriction endonuclease subunit S [Gammaproteobacteria bacterium]
MGAVFYEAPGAAKKNAKLPAGWKQTTIGEVCTVIAGQSPSSSHYNDRGAGLPFYQGKKHFGDYYIGEPTRWTERITTEAVAGDILMSVRAPVGPVNFATKRVCIGRGLAAIRAGEQVDREFLFYSLLSKQEQIQGSEGAVFASINKTQIEQISFAMPNLSEQKRVVENLKNTFAEIATATATTEKSIANAREAFESKLNYALKNSEAAHANDGMANGWATVEALKAFRQISPPKKIPRKQFRREGSFPIVSQEQNLISGFWSEDADVLHVDTPLVVFGDHTRVLKYVDFDFVVGADGVKLLQPEGFLLPKYLYYFLMGHPVKPLGYARHFRLLKKLEIVFPKSLAEQKRIVESLDRAAAATQSLLALYERKKKAFSELKKSLFAEYFPAN